MLPLRGYRRVLGGGRGEGDSAGISCNYNIINTITAPEGHTSFRTQAQNGASTTAFAPNSCHSSWGEGVAGCQDSVTKNNEKNASLHTHQLPQFMGSVRGWVQRPGTPHSLGRWAGQMQPPFTQMWAAAGATGGRGGR